MNAEGGNLPGGSSACTLANQRLWKRPPPGIPTQPDFNLDVDLDFLKSDTSQLISGAVYVRAAEYSEDISIPQLIVEYAQVDIESLPTTGAPEVALDITVEAYQSIRATNNLADVVASADLNARGTLQNPVILGTVTINSGLVFLENNELRDLSRDCQFQQSETDPTLCQFGSSDRD